MKKNVTGQSVGVEMISATDGSAFAGSVSVFVSVDSGSQVAGSGVSPAHKGNGYHSYSPAQAETNGDHVAFTFTGTGAIPATVQVYTGFPQSVDNDVVLQTLPVATDIVSAGAINTLSGSVVNVNLVDTTTVNTDMRGTDGANTIVPASLAQFEARTLPSSSYFDPSVDTVATVTTVTNMRGTDNALLSTNYTAPDNVGITQIQSDISNLNDLSFNDVWTGTLTESYAPNGSAMTPAQGMHMIWSDLRSPQQVSTTWSDFELDNTTIAMTFTLDDATTPTKKTRST